MDIDHIIFILAKGRRVLTGGLIKIHKAVKESKWCYFPASELFSDTSPDKFIEVKLWDIVHIEEKDLENISEFCLKNKV